MFDNIVEYDNIFAMNVSKRKIGKMGEMAWVLGIIFVSLGVCLCKKANLGVSMVAAPTFIIYEAISKYFSFFSIGTVEYIMQGLLLIVLCITVRRIKFRYILCFLAAVIYGYTLDLWMFIFGAEPFDTLAVRWIMLFAGIIITALGVAFFFRTFMPLQVYELFVSEVADKFNFAVNKIKLVYDLASFALSIVLAFTLFGDAKSFQIKMFLQNSYHSIGIGTVITSFINAPIIAFWGEILDKIFTFEPIFPKLKHFLVGGTELPQS